MSALVVPFRQRVEPSPTVSDEFRVYTYEEIGAELGISGERVRQIEQVALKKLRRRSVSMWTLREYWEP
jgi:DNA-directed RNA polymerase sigma subunit (sigma70/sigma32)